MKQESHKILVVEDHPDVRENICEILELAGYEVVNAKNGKEGIAKAVAKLPDLILCDVMMPELDGFGMLKILRENSKTRSIPAIFLTAKVEPADLRRGMGLGADDYITKPFDDTELLEAIETRIRKYLAEREALASYKADMGNLHSETREKENLEALRDSGEATQWDRDENLWQEGSYPAQLIYLQSGKVKISKVHETGKELIGALIDQPTFLGAGPILRQQTYSTQAIALEPSRGRVIPLDIFSRQLFENRDIGLYFLRLAYQQRDALFQNGLHLAYSSVRQRVMRGLWQLSKEGAEPVFSISRDDLAALAGTAKETTIRMLSELKSEGTIAIEGGKVRILKPEFLSKELY